MGLAVRIIPTLLKRGDALVKGERFNGWRSVGHVQQAAQTHAVREVDELIILDIGATPEGRGPDFAAVRRLERPCFMPLTVGGGVRSVDDVRRLMDAGADKVAICTGGPKLISDVAARVGCQAVSAALDVRNGYAVVRCGTYQTLQAATAWARSCEQHGAGEILLTSMDREGTMAGYDLDLIRDVCSAVDVPVIAHGGCSGYEDMLEAIRAGASAVAAGALFQFTDCTPRGAAEYLHEHGIEVRL